jgi:[ribosomal protein S5]-alanine N-acetyltransferase
MELKTKRLSLREVSLSDTETIHILHSLPESDEYNTMGVPENIDSTRELVLEWKESQVTIPRVKYVFCIEDNEGRFVGLIGLNLGKPKYRNAEVWFKLFPEFWKRGYATEALQSILAFSFEDLKLHRVEAGCAVENIASARVLEKSGMTKEGRCRRLLPIRGEWKDNFEFAILETDHFGAIK